MTWQRQRQRPSKSDPKDLWPLIHLIRVMRRHDMTNKKTIAKTNIFRKHPHRAIQETFCGIWSVMRRHGVTANKKTKAWHDIQQDNDTLKDSCNLSYNKPNLFFRQSRQNSTMIDCMKTYDARNAWNSCLLILPNAEWTGPERCIHEHIEFSSCNNQGLRNSLATCNNTKY